MGQIASAPRRETQPGLNGDLLSQAESLETASALLNLGKVLVRVGHLLGAHISLGVDRDLISVCEALGALTQFPSEGEQADQHARPSVPSEKSRTQRADGLTLREVEVLGLLAAGNTNQEIAAELVLSVHTVERHLQNAYRKIGARNRADAAAYIVRDAGL